MTVGSVALGYLTYSAHLKIVKRIQDERDKAKALRQEERKGRIRAEKSLAELKSLRASSSSSAEEDDKDGSFDIPVVAEVRSPFDGRNGTPRQPDLVQSALARIQLKPQVPGAALQGLEEFSHVWVLYIFNKNTDLQETLGPLSKSTTRKGKVRVPRLNGELRGVYSTRSPHRFAPVGLSLCRIVRVEDR